MPLERSVPSTAEVSGAVVEGRIADISCQVLLPRLPPKGWKVQPPTDDDDWSHAGGIWWGGAGVGIDGRHISIKALGLAFPSIELEGDEARKLKDSVRSAAYPWLERLIDWLAVLHGEPAMSISIEAPLMFLEFDPDLDPVAWHEPTNRVNLSTWQSAIANASANRNAPLGLVLFHKSAVALFEGDYRLAVINAATALELAVTSALARTLGESAGPVLAQVRMLGPRLELANRLGLPVPLGTHSQLLQLRNRVMHEAAVPSREEVAKALDEFVAAASELPDSDLD